MNIRKWILVRFPWWILRRTMFTLRKWFFTTEKPGVDGLIVYSSVINLELSLGRLYFNPGWKLSYHYYSEDYNSRRYYRTDASDHPHRQIHVRGFELDDNKIRLIAHEEPAPEHHPVSHLKGEDVDWDTGKRVLKGILDRSGTTYSEE